MVAIKLTEQYAVDSLRRDVRDSLIMAGEPCILLQMYHPEVDKDAPRCPNCQDDVYTSGEGDCTICYGTTIEGGVKAALQVYGLFSDHVAAEQWSRQGMWPPDAREIQTEAFPLLLEHDIVIRVRDWDEFQRPAAVEGFYNIAQVTRTSLRTGTRSGQQRWDVVGQRAAITLVNQTLPITQYPVLGKPFSGKNFNPATSAPVVSAPVAVAPVPNSAFTHLQAVPLDTWTITHQFDHPPGVTVIVNQELVEPDVYYPKPDIVRIEFAEPTAGIAVLV
jgi:hypothetical protein